VDIMGDGPMRDDVIAMAKGLGHVMLRWLPPVAYGAPFSAALRGYHAILVPTLSDEQPRIIYDAFAQAVPVIASDTAGHQAAVIDGQTGYRFAQGSAEALLAQMTDLAAAPDKLRQMGLAAREVALGSTHQLMHLRRAEELAKLFAKDK
jgi:glycosyltransferase involved in cell wall biosynthesis